MQYIYDCMEQITIYLKLRYTNAWKDYNYVDYGIVIIVSIIIVIIIYFLGFWMCYVNIDFMLIT